MNKVINLYRTFYPSRENERDEDAVRSFVEKANHSGDLAFDSDVVSQYIENPLFVERKIIDSILDLENIHLDVEYLSVYSKQMNAAGASSEDDKAIVVDELWSYTALSFFLTVFSLAYDSGKENFTRCIKNCFVLLDLQGRKREIGVHSLNDIEQMISLPANIMNLAMDSFWTAWTFMIGHELYHLTEKDDAGNGMQEELDADAYGYKVLIGMIEAQKRGFIPEEIRIFYEDYYLAPVMLFEYFRFLDQYRSLCGESAVYADYPSPQQRQEQIFNLFDDCIPDSFDTTMGNEVLNLFLDTSELLWKQIRLKKERGKLNLPETE